MPLNDAVPSTAFDVLQRNAQDIDSFTNNASGTVVTRTGDVLTPLPVLNQQAQTIIESLGYIDKGTFTAGATLSYSNEILSDGTDYWRWSGAFPKVVAAGSSPSPSGVGAWLNIGDSTKWTELAAVDSTQVIAGVAAGDLVERYNLVVNLVSEGADNTGATSVNAAMRSALAKLTDAGGGVLEVPAGTYQFVRELDSVQPPLTATFTSQTAGFTVPDNVTIRSLGNRESTKFLIPCPGQKAGALNSAQYWQFIVHGDNFSCEGITFEGDVAAGEFEFVAFWGGGTVPSLFSYANMTGNIFGYNVSIKNCRLTNCRGFAYSTAIIHGFEFTGNDLAYTNGVNASGKDIRVDRNTWYMCELVESSGQPYGYLSDDKIAGISFSGNVCRECNGGAIGGNVNTSDLSKTYGYQFNNNVIMNFVHSASSGFSIANNALSVECVGNVIVGLFSTCLSITQGGIADCPPYDVHVIGGHYKSTRSDGSAFYGIRVDTAEGNVHLNGVTIQGVIAALSVNGASTTNVFVDGGTTLVGQYGIALTSGNASIVKIGRSVKWLPTTANTTDMVSNLASTTGNGIEINTNFVITKDGTYPAAAVVECNKKYGGNQSDPRYGYFLRYLNGRMGWGDPTANALADVYLERKAANVLGLDAGDAWRAGTTTTAGRPTASAVGAGSQMFDTTLNKPIWSDGTNWRDAAGTIV